MQVGQDIRTRILLSFLLGIALPSGLLGYFAFRGIRNERALVDRERRIELEALSERLSEEVEGRLLALERRVAEANPEELRPLVANERALRAVFTVDSGLEARIVAADGLFFERDADPGMAPPPARPHPELVSARRQELTVDDPRGALRTYTRAAEEAASAQVRAEALMGVARIQRRLGDGAASARSYERLISDFGQARTSTGIPLAAAARLELGALLLDQGDSARAVRVTLPLYGELIEGRWVLTSPRFDFLVSATREFLEPLSTTGPPDLSDTLDALSRTLTLRRGAAETLREFEIGVGRALLHADGGGEKVRTSIDVGAHVFPAIVLPEDETALRIRRGLIFHPPILVEQAVPAVLSDRSNGFAWSLRTPSGETVAASDVSPSPEARMVSSGLSGFPGWTLGLAHSREALTENLLTSRRAVYLYALILIAGILVSGLILTLRTVGRELELARMKSDFVSTVSHEFKSPLTAIRQLAEMLRAGRVPSEERRTQYYDVLLEQSERLSLLVDNVLDFARTEGGRRRLNREPTDPTALVREAVEDARQRVAHEDFSIRIELDESLPEATLDRDAFQQALANLIDNAVKYSGASREVVVRGYRMNGEIVVAVQDFGVGMKPDEVAHVFERFYRGGHELTRNVKGTGLGLALVKQIVEGHGGVVEVESDAGRGSTFAMRFPTAASDDPDARGE